jgi:hypothetical protein
MDLFIIVSVLLVSFLFKTTPGLPVVDKGVFVIVGVKSCGGGSGYCILGPDCTIDKEFKVDEGGGNCDGLKTAFTPSAPFSCCQLVEVPITSTTTTTTTSTAPSSSSSSSSTEIDSSVESLETSSPSAGSDEDSADDEVNNSSQEDHLNNTTTTTTTIYEEKTEINLEEMSISLELICGNEYHGGGGQGSPRVVGSQHSSTRGSTCHTGALVRSPSSTYSLSDPGSFLCTGSMISRDYMLTSATCVSRILNQDLNLFRVVLGSEHLVHPSHGTGAGDYRNIEEIRVHQNYTSAEMSSSTTTGGNYMRVKINDIALIKLSDSESTSNESSSYCTICLPDPAQVWTGGTQDCTVTGYSHPADSNEADGFLHQAPQSILEHCPPGPNLICAKGEKSAEACFSPRDAGSPLTCTVDGSLKLAGIFSSGFHCGSEESPVHYTDVRNYVNWIRDVV